MIRINSNNQGFTILNVVLVFIIVSFIAFSTFYRKPQMNEPTRELLENEGISSSTHQELLNSTVSKIHEYQAIHYNEDSILKRYGQDK